MEEFKTQVFEKAKRQSTNSFFARRYFYFGLSLFLVFFIFQPNQDDPSWVLLIKFIPLLAGLLTVEFVDMPFWRRKELVDGNFIGEFKMTNDAMVLLDNKCYYENLTSIIFYMDKHAGQQLDEFGPFNESKGGMNRIVIVSKNNMIYDHYFLIESALHSDKLYYWFQKLKKELPNIKVEWVRKKVKKTSKVTYSVYEVIVAAIIFGVYIYLNFIY